MINESEAFSLLERLLGFRAEPTRAEDVVRALGERLRARGCSDASAYGRLLDDARASAEEARALGDRLTVNETYFLREALQLDLVVEKFVPQLLGRGSVPVRILSVGCATGDEPHGIALRLHEAGVPREHVEILGIDVSSKVIASARRGQYSEWALRNVPLALRSRYFERDRKGYRLAAELTSRVRFEVANLVDGNESFWAASQFDIVLCRNLLIYLTSSAIELAMQRFARVLSPGGVLMLGHAETSLAGPRFEVEEQSGAFFFRRRTASNASARRTPAAARAPGVADEPAPYRARADAANANELLEPIERSHVRMQALMAKLPPAAEPAPAEPVEELAYVVELIRQERFEEALAGVETRGGDEQSECWLLRALILTNLGRTLEAVDAARARLARVPGCPFSHYLLGVCAETRFLFEQALGHYAHAAELDPAFAMAFLRAGILARRAGQPEEARRALTAAIERFPEQGARTQLLYGGGFSRELLASLGRAELSALCTSGARP
jgi:chemotaxis protein methyltransferase CheR